MRLIDSFSDSPRRESERTDTITLRRNPCGSLTGVAILDGGATTVNAFHNGFSAAWWAAHLAGDVFAALPATATLADYCAAVQQRYTHFQHEHAAPGFPLYASLVAVVQRGGVFEAWHVGDIRLGYMLPGSTVLRQKNLLPREGDLLATTMRRATITEAMHNASLPAENGMLARIGSRHIQGILSSQLRWANTTFSESNGFAFDALCAERPVQSSAQRVKTLAPHTRVVMGSDGFLSLKPTIALMRQELLDMRDSDPHMIDEADANIRGFFDDDGTLHTCFDDTSAAIVQL